VSDHAYEHLNDFPGLTRNQFKDKCKNLMNNKNAPHYLDTTNGRTVAYDAAMKMLSVGEVDGRTVITCFFKKQADMNNDINHGRYKMLR
jgi:phosphatidylserine decarboxylase